MVALQVCWSGSHPEGLLKHGDGTVSSVRNTSYLQSEGEMLPGLEFHFFCCVSGWLVGLFLSWISLSTENSVSR